MKVGDYFVKDILKIPFAKNTCPHCEGKGKLPSPNVGFILHSGDVVEDHYGLLVRIDEVYKKDTTTGWGTTLNAMESWVLGPNHSNHRVETNNDTYIESLWTFKNHK